MKQKIFKLKYNIDYTAPRMNPPYNLVLLADGVAAGPPGNTSPPSDRMLLSHRREIKDKKNGTTIGDASYLIHIHKIELNGEKTSGAIYGTFTAHHEFKKNGNEYDITYSGNTKWILGKKTEFETIDPSSPFLNVITNNLDNITALSVFKNGKKINHGNNKVTLSNDGTYQIKWIYDMYDFC